LWSRPRAAASVPDLRAYGFWSGAIRCLPAEQPWLYPRSRAALPNGWLRECSSSRDARNASQPCECRHARGCGRSPSAARRPSPSGTHRCGARCLGGVDARSARAKFEAMTERIHGHIEPNFLVFCGLSSHIAAIWRKIGFATIRIAETTEQRSGKPHASSHRAEGRSSFVVHCEPPSTEGIKKPRYGR